MVKIINSLLVKPINAKHEKNIIDIIFLEKEVSEFLKKNEHRNLKVEWKQCCTTDGKSIFIVITAFISTN